MEENREAESSVKEKTAIETETNEDKLHAFLQLVFIILFIFGLFLFCAKGFTVEGLVGALTIILSVIGSIQVK